ncbi:phasin family protein [Methanomethylovorans sp.]|uniref:phasin family protein n=1 Tax=Methanomethylovorans sp. TaxID=2758717 RepID=UPI00351BF241
MKGTLKKLGLFGIGLWALTEDKINELSKELIESGEMNKEEGKKFVKEVLEEQKKQKEDIEKKINAKVQETFKRADVVKKEDLKILKEQMQQIQNKLDEIIGEKKEDTKKEEPKKEEEE